MEKIDIADWQTRRLNVIEVGSVLGVSAATVWRWVAAGKLPSPHKLGANCTRWDGAAIAKALQDQPSLPPKPNPNPVSRAKQEAA